MDRIQVKRLGGISLIVLAATDVGWAGTISELWERAWKSESSPDELVSATRKVEDEIRQVDPERKVLMAACELEEVVGFCRIARDENDESLWWIKGLAVRKDRRRRGIATDLLRAAVAYATARGATLVRSTADPWNRASIRCHEKAGFCNKGELVAEDGDRKVAFSQRCERGDS